MSTTNTAVPVVFIHGLWLHATSWEPWVTLFADAGHAPLAPGWPGEPATVAAARANPSAVAGRGIEAVADHYAGVIADLPARPILVGHSFGGLIAQILLCRGVARAAVALDPAPFRGVLPVPFSALKVATAALKNPLNRGRALSLTAEQWVQGFGNALDDAEARELHERLAIPSPARPIFEAAFANLNPATPARVRTAYTTRGPLLITAADRDRTVPSILSRWAARQYAGSTGYVELHEFLGRGHSLVVDHGWREVAELTLSWIAEHVLPGHRPPQDILPSRPAQSPEGSRHSPARRPQDDARTPDSSTGTEPPPDPAGAGSTEPSAPSCSSSPSSSPDGAAGGPDAVDGETSTVGAAPAVPPKEPETQVGTAANGPGTAPDGWQLPAVP